MTSIHEIIEIIDSDDDDTVLNIQPVKENLDFFFLNTHEKESVANQALRRRGKRQRDNENNSKAEGDSKDIKDENIDNDDDDDDEVVIVDAPPKKIDEIKKYEVENSVIASKKEKKIRITTRARKKKQQLNGADSAKSGDETSDDGDNCEIQVCGISNSQVFSHMRQHCTQFPFILNQQKGRKKNNMKICDKCYCYVCDIIASSCKDWGSHCNASEKGTKSKQWFRMREQEKREKDSG